VKNRLRLVLLFSVVNIVFSAFTVRLMNDTSKVTAQDKIFLNFDLAENISLSGMRVDIVPDTYTPSPNSKINLKIVVSNKSLNAIKDLAIKQTNIPNLSLPQTDLQVGEQVEFSVEFPVPADGQTLRLQLEVEAKAPLQSPSEIFSDVEVWLYPNSLPQTRAQNWPDPKVLNFPVSCETKEWYVTAGTNGTYHVGTNNEYAVDFAILGDTTGQGVHAMHNGAVKQRYTDSYGAKILELWVGNTTTHHTVYAHFIDWATLASDGNVRVGDLIGYAGATGLGNGGAHVHVTLAQPYGNTFLSIPFSSIGNKDFNFYGNNNVKACDVGDYIPDQADTSTSWNFANERHGWEEKNGLNFLGHIDGGMVYDVTGVDPIIEGPQVLFPADDHPYLHIYMETDADACGEIFWRRSGDANFDESRKINISPKNTTGTHLVVVYMAGNPNWNGTIVQLRLDPACVPDAPPNGLRINRIELSKETCTSATSWDFSSQRHGWQEINALTFNGHVDGGMHYDVTGEDPRILSPLMCGISTQAYRYMIIQMASQVDACGQVFFRRAQDVNFSELSGDDRHFEIYPEPSGDTHNVIIDLATNPFWNGSNNQDNITHLALDPACVPSGFPDGVRIDKVYFTDDGPTQTPTPTPTITITPPPAGSIELLNNTSFEQAGSTNAVPAGWTLKNPTKDKRKCNKDGKPPVAHNGDCAFQFNGDPGKTTLEQSVILQNNLSDGTLTLYAWFNIKSQQGGKLMAKVQYTNGEKGKLKLEVPTSGEGQYGLKSTQGTILNTVESLKIIVSMKNGSGKFLIDDVSLILTTSLFDVLDRDVLLPLPSSPNGRSN
jgi:murein DD-endopeptidase MepM/ murein hydrolase activator NlpD